MVYTSNQTRVLKLSEISDKVWTVWNKLQTMYSHSFDNLREKTWAFIESLLLAVGSATMGDNSPSTVGFVFAVQVLLFLITWSFVYFWSFNNFLFLQIGIGIIAFFLFSSLRLTASLRRFYAPKRCVLIYRWEYILTFFNRDCRHIDRFDKTLEEKPRRLPPGFFSWWYIILTTPEEEVLRVAGLDMAVFIRILTFGQFAEVISIVIHHQSLTSSVCRCRSWNFLLHKLVGAHSGVANKSICKHHSCSTPYLISRIFLKTSDTYKLAQE
jgi:hypothetical protein